MDGLDNAYFNSLMNNANNSLDLEEIKRDCIVLFKESIQEVIYSYYSPSFYSRTDQLINSVVGKIINGVIYVYIDDSNLDYHSWVNFYDTGKQVGSIVPWLIEMGHNGSEGYGEYRNFEPRKYLERVKEVVLQKYIKYGINVEIINDAPSTI